MKRFLAVLMTLLVMVGGSCSAWADGNKSELNITCWDGYAKPYVDDFKLLVKEKYKIDLEIKIHNPVDQDEFYEAAKTGKADLISPPQDMVKNPKFYCFDEGNILLRTPDLKNIPNFKHILTFFQEDQALIHKQIRYGVPYNCGPYGLAYNTEVVKSSPTSWNIFWGPQYKGKYTINNNFPKCNIWISALSLGYSYEDIFEVSKLDREKVQTRLNQLVKNAKSLWDGAANADEFPNLSLATTWGFAAQQANLKGGKWLLAAPKEGGTAWIDYWCITSSAKGLTKRLCEEWINFMLAPERQADVVHAQGVSPAVDNIGDLVTETERKMFHVGDNDYFKTVAQWRVMDNKTVAAFAEMWEIAKQQRK
ncbi:MAG: extracellular solute-binding protein [Deltaproteobacteria bacterium]|nr:extracellular solute-binding protein [Candidatus Tharpella aukensis]